MAAIFTTPPGRVIGAPAGALVCTWSPDPDGRLVGRWSPVPATPRAPLRPARDA